MEITLQENEEEEEEEEEEEIDVRYGVWCNVRI